MKNDYIQLRISEQEKGDLSQMSTELDKPISQIVREAVREKVDEWKTGPGSKTEAAVETMEVPA